MILLLVMLGCAFEGEGRPGARRHPGAEAPAIEEVELHCLYRRDRVALGRVARCDILSFEYEDRTWVVFDPFTSHPDMECF